MSIVVVVRDAVDVCEPLGACEWLSEEDGEGVTPWLDVCICEIDAV